MAERIPDSRSLVPLQAGAARGAGPSRAVRDDSMRSLFAAQLLAGKLHAPISRRLRRAEPAEALRLYGETAGLRPAPRPALARTA